MEGDYNLLPFNDQKSAEINEGVDVSKYHVTHNSKYRYYYKNFVLLSFSIIFLFAAVYSSSNLLTTIAGKTLGFASLAVYSFIGFTMTCISPTLIRSFGMRRIVAFANLFFSIYVASQFYVSYFTLIPGAFFCGLAASMYWISTITYLNKLAITYANEYDASHVKMMSFANGVVMTSYAGGVLLGNALSSSILLPSGLDEQSVPVGNDSCNLEQSVDQIDPYNEYLLVLRGVLLLCALVAFIIVLLFLDDIKGESVNEQYSRSTFTKVLLELQNSSTEIYEIFVRKRYYLLFCFPLSISASMVEAFTIGSFPKEYISACFGIHMVGYTAMVYAFFSAVSSFLTGKVYLSYLPRYVVAIFTTLITMSLVMFLIIWERQPSYVFVFTFIALWGIVVGQWITLAPCYIGHMLPDNLEIAYMLHTLLFLMGYFINFVSGIILDVQGVQYLIIVCLAVSLPLYLLAEAKWEHKSFRAVNIELENKIVQNVRALRKRPSVRDLMFTSYSTPETKLIILFSYYCITVILLLISFVVNLCSVDTANENFINFTLCSAGGYREGCDEGNTALGSDLCHSV